MRARSFLPILTGLIAAGADATQARDALAPCEWCGQVHPRLELCPPRPLARGISRRSFLQLTAAAAVGAMLPKVPLPADYTHTTIPLRTLYARFPLVDWDPLFKEVYAPGIADLLNNGPRLLDYIEDKS